MIDNLKINEESELKFVIDSLFTVFENGREFELTSFEEVLSRLFPSSVSGKVMDVIERECNLFVKNDPASEGHSMEQVLSKRRGMKALAIHEVVSRVVDERPDFLDVVETKMTWVQEKMNVEIHPQASIDSAAIDHGTGTVVGGTAVIEDGVFLYHAVTLGNSRGAQFKTSSGRRHPWLQSGVRVFAGANIFGPCVLKKGSRVSANGVLIDSILGKNSVVGPKAQLQGVEVPDNIRIEWAFLGRFCIGKKKGGLYCPILLKRIGLDEINELEGKDLSVLEK